MEIKQIAVIVVFVLMVLGILFLISKILNKDVNLRSPGSKTIKIVLWIAGIALVVYLVFFKFEGCNNEEEEENEVFVMIWKEDSTIYYQGLTPFRIKLDFEYRIVTECGRVISISNPSWNQSTIDRGCSNKTNVFPRHEWGSIFTIKKIE